MQSSIHAPPAGEVLAFSPDEELPHPTPASTAPTSNMNCSLSTSQRHAFQQSNIVQHNGIYHQFNATQAPFQPVATGQGRYETPRTFNVPIQHDQLLDLISRQNIHHITEIARMDHKYRSLAGEFDAMRGRLQNDIPAIHQRLSHLASDRRSGPVQKQIESQDASDIEAAANYIHYHVSPDGSPSEKMLARHSKDELFKFYHDEADSREISAMQLREKAFELFQDSKQGPSRPLQIESAPAAIQAAAPDFACCSTVFSALGELVEHVERAHTVPEHRFNKRAHSKATEIKPPPEAQISSAAGHNFLPLTAEKDEIVASSNSIKQDFSASSWTPVAVRDMPTVQFTVSENAETFSFEFLRTTFFGEVWSPGYYFISNKGILPSKSYWILELTDEPFLPQKPGEHGAKLTAFFNDTPGYETPGPEHYLNVPVFIKTADQDEYSYFGNYSQLRFSDKIGYDTMTDHIPESVLRSHAEQLAETGRPAWVTQALKEHFWPMPKYYGPFPTDPALNTPASSDESGNKSSARLERRVKRALDEYADELKNWEKDANLKVSLLTAESILQSFSLADIDTDPGLRLWFEYLQCVGYDLGFYQMLVNLKRDPLTKVEIGAAGKERRQSIDRRDGSTAAKKGLPAEATFKPTRGKGKAREVMEEYPGPEAKTKFVKPSFDGPPVILEAVKKAGASIGTSKAEVSKSTTNPSVVPPTRPKGDLKAAKAFNESVKKGGNYMYVPPHQRVKK